MPNSNYSSYTATYVKYMKNSKLLLRVIKYFQNMKTVIKLINQFRNLPVNFQTPN